MSTNRLRVAYVVKVFPRYSETFIVNEILAHEAAGLDVEIFSLRAPTDTHFQDSLARLRAPVRYLPHEGIRSAEYWDALRRASETCGSLDGFCIDAAHDDGRTVYQALVLAEALLAGGFDHAHAHFASAAASVTRLAAALARVPWSVTAHAKDIFHEDSLPDDLARKFRSADAVVTVSDFNRDYLGTHYAIESHRLTRIYNGLDVEHLQVAPDGERPIDVLAVGRFVEKKGFDVLIEAVARLRGQGRALNVALIGSGELDVALREQVARAQLQPQVQFLGPQPQSDVMAALRRAKLFAAPSITGHDGNREGLPTTILEAMALGTPVVATATTGVPEVVEDCVTGRLVAERDPIALAEAIAHLLDDRRTAKACALRARARIERDFDIRRTSAELRSIFGSCARTVLMEAV